MSASRRGRHESIVHAIGSTPLIRLTKVTERISVPIYAKAEFFNPGGSLKDRIGGAIIEAAEEHIRSTILNFLSLYIWPPVQDKAQRFLSYHFMRA